jgi:hypothetical protein
LELTSSERFVAFPFEFILHPLDADQLPRNAHADMSALRASGRERALRPQGGDTGERFGMGRVSSCGKQSVITQRMLR